MKTIKLVVVMSAVNLWKPRKHQWRSPFIEVLSRWCFVRILENLALLGRTATNLEFSPLSSIDFPHLSQTFSTGPYDAIAAES